MNGLKDFEDELRATLFEVEASATPPAGLAERLVANASSARRGTVHRVDFRARVGAQRWLPPLLAAAAVVAVVAVGATVIDSTNADHKTPITPVGTQPDSPVVPPTAPTTSPTPTNDPTPTSDPTATRTTAKSSLPVGTPVPAGFAAASVYFRDASNGYAIGNVPCSAQYGYCATLVRTTDGGQSWLQIPLPDGLTAVNDQGNESAGGSCGTNGGIAGPCVNRVVFADATHGFVFSLHELYLTNDGGRTWIKQKAQDGTDARVSKLTVQGDTVVRLGPLHDCSSGCQVPVYRAALGSSTWTESTVPGGAPVLGSQLVTSGSRIYLLAFRFVGANNDASYTLYESTDGAASWQPVNNDTCEGALVPSAGDGVTCVVSSTPVWMPAGDISYRLSSDGKSVEISTDGGKTSAPHAF